MAERGLWLFIDFPRLALEAWFGPMPQGTSPPQLLLSGNGQEVAQCNAPAEALGVRPSMSTRTAYCLLEHTEIAHHDPQLEREQLHRLALVLYRLCAEIRLCPPAGLLLEVGSMLRLSGGLEPFLRQVHHHLRQCGYSYHCAIGHTALAAQVLAHNRCDAQSRDPARLRALLDDLPVERLGFALRNAARLRAMGLETYRQLSRAPRAELGYRFGQPLIARLNALEQPDTLGQSFTLPPYFHERLELAHEAEQAGRLLFPINRLLQALEAYLRARQLVADSLHIRLEHRDQPPTRMRIQAVRGARTAQEWQSLVSLALERQTLPAPAIGVHLSAHRFRPDRHPPADLLGTAHPEADADRLLTLLVSRLGHDRVCTPVTGADPRPLEAGRLEPATHASAGSEDHGTSRRQPGFLLPAPIRVDVAEYRILAGAERIVIDRKSVV